MSGTFATTSTNIATGNALIDGLLAPDRWADATLFYSVPRFVTEYGVNYGVGETAGFFATTNAMGVVIDFTLNAEAGNSADDGFSIEGFTNLNVTYTTFSGAHIRLAQTTSDPYGIGTAWGYYPFPGNTGGDVWFSNVLIDYSAPVTGTYAAITIMHEIGHAMGLEHSQDNGTHGAVPGDFDAMEYTIMSYRSFVGASATGGYKNETFGYAQSFMMLDIQALQYMYGADFTTNSGDTTYSWSPTSGNTMVNGVAAISPGANRIFATIWDGGGVDTYDLSAYSDDLKIDLRPGGYSLFSATQQAGLGGTNKAQGNIYNALKYQDDTRSLIENAIGGSGDDLLQGNQLANVLRGNGGQDRLLGLNGKDILKGGAAKDVLKGGAKNDTLQGNNGFDRLFGDAGKDILKGGNGNDRMTGGAGKDTMYGGAGSDTFRFAKVTDSKTGSASDVIKDFKRGLDKIDLSVLTTTPFTFDSNGFSGSGPSITTNKNGDRLMVRVDVDGDASADMRIILEGVNNLSAGDFIL